ncbi:MAG TPA: hypothetical protein VML75_20565 [Kofleriaceae bacterium]|nr:hypothetical protein [Kofleriaceae bacterium]
MKPSALLVHATCTLLIACGGKPTPSTTTAPATDLPPAPMPVPFEVRASAAVEARVLLPDALTNLEWPAPPINRSVDAQRRRFTTAGRDAKQREAANLATALWYSEPSGSDAERAAREAARTALREVATGGGSSETVLWMLTVAERSLGDLVASKSTYDELILRFPQSPRAWRYRAERAWLELLEQNHPRASEFVNGADLAAQATPSAVHYVAGWIELRRGQPTEGHALLVTAAQRWADLWSWDTIRQEAFQVAAIANAEPAYMLQIASEIVNGPPRREAGTTNKRLRTVVRNGKRTTISEETTISYRKEWLGLELGRAYARFGRFEAAREVLERSRGSDPATNASIEHELMMLAAAANQPAAVATHAEAARDAFAKAMVDSSAGDVREQNDALMADVQRLANEYRGFGQVTGLEDFKAAGDALGSIAESTSSPTAPLTPDIYRAAVIDTQVAWSTPRLRACYELPLQSQPSFAGSVSFTLAPGDDGRATLSQLSPEAGDDGMASVAGCVAEVVANWRMTPVPGASATTATIAIEFRHKLDPKE